MEKSLLLQQLTDSIGTIYQISEKNDEYNAICSEINEAKNASEKMGEPGISSLLFNAIIFIPLMLFNGDKIEGFGLDPRGASMLILILAVSLSIIEIFIISKCWRSHKAKKAERYRDSIIPGLEQKLHTIAHQLEELVNTKEAQDLLNTIPQDYATYDAVSFFIVALRNERADTLKEAINLYEEELHRRALVDMHQQELILDQQQIALQQAILTNQQESTQIQQNLLKKTEKISRQVRFSNAIGIINTVKLWGGRIKTK